MVVGWNLTKMPDNQNEIFCFISSSSNFDFKKLMEQRIKAVVSLTNDRSDHSDEFALFFFFNGHRLLHILMLICKKFIECG